MQKRKFNYEKRKYFRGHRTRTPFLMRTVLAYPEIGKLFFLWNKPKNIFPGHSGIQPKFKNILVPLNNCYIFHLSLVSVPLPKGRLFSYVDTHRHRLGPNYHQIPVNCPFAARPAHYLRDGPMTIDDNQGMAGYVALALVSSRSVCIRLAQE